jgi:hypothetical protein
MLCFCFSFFRLTLDGPVLPIFTSINYLPFANVSYAITIVDVHQQLYQHIQ